MRAFCNTRSDFHMEKTGYQTDWWLHTKLILNLTLIKYFWKLFNFSEESSRCRNFSDLIGRTKCNSIVNFNTLLRKKKIWGLEKFQFYTTLVALFEIRFRFLFFDIEKRRQCIGSNYSNTLRSFIIDLFKRDAFRLYRDWNNLIINQ